MICSVSTIVVINLELETTSLKVMSSMLSWQGQDIQIICKIKVWKTIPSSISYGALDRRLRIYLIWYNSGWFGSSARAKGSSMVTYSTYSTQSALLLWNNSNTLPRSNEFLFGPSESARPHQNEYSFHHSASRPTRNLPNINSANHVAPHQDVATRTTSTMATVSLSSLD